VSLALFNVTAKILGQQLVNVWRSTEQSITDSSVVNFNMFHVQLKACDADGRHFKHML